jgi:hypothetical protein
MLIKEGGIQFSNRLQFSQYQDKMKGKRMAPLSDIKPKPHRPDMLSQPVDIRYSCHYGETISTDIPDGPNGRWHPPF